MLLDYCDKYFISPPETIFLILEDQKVTPMIRGKAMVYNAEAILQKVLPESEWAVQKLNISGQPGDDPANKDEDISITHRRKNISLTVESKSAVRGSMQPKRRLIKPVKKVFDVPTFQVKSHRSRSTIKLAATTNDRYAANSFDILITNPLNAIYQKGTIGPDLELIRKEPTRAILREHYGAAANDDLIPLCASDWRFCDPQDIAEDGFVPRTPTVELTDDPNWKPLTQLESVLLSIVERKLAKHRQARTRRS